VLDDHLARQRKLLQGRAPDETAEAERKAEMADFKGRMLASTIRTASTEPAPRAGNEPESADNA
jgi:hypothetical protein